MPYSVKILALILSIVSDPSHGTSMTSPGRVHSDTFIATVEEAGVKPPAEEEAGVKPPAEGGGSRRPMTLGWAAAIPLRLSSTLSRDA